jgi:hypothetical protein
MRGHRAAAWLGACAMAATIAVGCGSAPATTPADIPASTEFAIRTPTPSAALPSVTPAAVPAEPVETEATPLPTMDPSLIGNWTGELEGVRGPVERWEVTHSIVGPCAAVDETCGTWEMSGAVSSEVDWAPWAVLGEEVKCRGRLRYQGMLAEATLLLAAVDASGSSESGCGVWMHRLALQAGDGVRLEVTAPGIGVGSKAKWGYGTLHRIDGTPAPSGS